MRASKWGNVRQGEDILLILGLLSEASASVMTIRNLVHKR